jgi:hypothetical protein
MTAAVLGALLLIAWSGALAAADTLARIEEQLVRAPVVRASFAQERTMRVLKRPLETGGRVTAVAGQGVLWQVLEPYESTMLVSAGAIVEWDGQGAPRRLEIAANPALRALADALLGLLTGDTGALVALFEPTPLQAEQGWRLALAPKDEALAALIERVEVAGGRFVEEAVISEAGGDRTAIAFDDFQTDPSTLDAAEQAYFAQR